MFFLERKHKEHCRFLSLISCSLWKWYILWYHSTKSERGSSRKKKKNSLQLTPLKLVPETKLKHLYIFLQCPCWLFLLLIKDLNSHKKKHITIIWNMTYLRISRSISQKNDSMSQLSMRTPVIAEVLSRWRLLEQNIIVISNQTIFSSKERKICSQRTWKKGTKGSNDLSSILAHHNHFFISFYQLCCFLQL